MEEEKVNILYSRSSYGTDKPHMNKQQTDVFKYPCIQNINVKNEVGCTWYSYTNENGHFNVPKVVFGVFGKGVYADIDGKYALCQHSRGIIDSIDNLQFIEKALLNPKFIELMKMTDVGGLSTIFNHKVIALFRKDFWKDYI